MGKQFKYRVKSCVTSQSFTNLIFFQLSTFFSKFFHRSTLQLTLLLVLPVINVAAQENLSVNDFAKRIQSGKIQLLDVRTTAEFGNGHLAGSMHADWLNKKQFAERVKHLDKKKPLLVYCASGIRSEQAANWFTEQGFAEVYNLQGGAAAWSRAGKPLEGNKSVKALSVVSFTEQIATGTVLVDIGAEWCPPCKKMEPVLDSLQKAMGKKYKLVKVDGGNDTKVMQHLNASVLPTFIVYRNGKETWRREGVLTLAELQKTLQ